jgi:hypothetical protein
MTRRAITASPYLSHARDEAGDGHQSRLLFPTLAFGVGRLSEFGRLSSRQCAVGELRDVGVGNLEARHCVAPRQTLLTLSFNTFMCQLWFPDLNAARVICLSVLRQALPQSIACQGCGR